MQLTHKAIARAAGYRVDSSYASYPNMNLGWNTWYYWYETDSVDGNFKDSHGRFHTEQEAYADCCKQNGLVHE